MTSNIELAKELLRKAEALGCKPTLEGNWVVFRPPLPAALIYEASRLGDQLAELVSAP